MSKFKTKKINECTTVQVTLCGEAKQKVLDRQGNYLKQTGTMLSKERAILKIMLGV